MYHRPGLCLRHNNMPNPLPLVVLIPLILGTSLCFLAGRVDTPARRSLVACVAAAVTARTAGRVEDEGQLRDAVLLTRAGDDVGPAGRMLLAWRRLATRPAEQLLTLADVAQVLEGLGLARDDEAVSDLVDDVLDSAARRKLLLATGASLLLAVADAVAVALVLPLIELAAGTQQQSGILSVLVSLSGTTDVQQLTRVVVFWLVGLFVVKDLAAMALHW